MGNRLSAAASLFGKPKKEHRILINGLDASGKTTILYQWKLGEVVTTIPTIGFNVESVSIGNKAVLTAWDVGGRDKMRPLWRHYYQNTDMIVFVVDSNDNDRLDQARDELHRICSEDELVGVPVLVLCNKQDLPHAMSPEKISEEMDLAGIRTKGSVRFLGVVATTGQGLREALGCIDDMLSQPHKEETKASGLMDEDIPPPLPDYAQAAGNPTLDSFLPIQRGTECPFAKSAKLWGGNPNVLSEGLSLEEQAKGNLEALTRFVYQCQQKDSRLDGFCMELDDVRARGTASSASVAEFGECVRVFLTALSDLDPKKEFCMRVSYIGARGWRFRFGGVDFFATSFAPCYPMTSSRYAFGTNKAFVLLQPEESFLRHRLPSDTAETNWEQPQTVRDTARVAYKKAGRPYHIPNTTKYPPAEHIVKPLHDDGVNVVRWWDPNALPLAQ